MEIILECVSVDALRAALSEVLLSEAFRRAQRMQRLLAFLVDRHVGGVGRAVNEYAIGIDVFDRDPSTYDTCADPIVRVQVGRLREKLRAYYALDGRHAGVRFSIPLGSYMLEVETMSSPPPPSLPASQPPMGRQYLLALSPLAFFTGDADAAAFARGLNEELAHHLFKAFGQTIVTHTVEGRGAGVSHRLECSMRVYEAVIRISVRLIDSAAGCIVWSDQFDGRAPYAIGMQERLAVAICAGLERYFALG